MYMQACFTCIDLHASPMTLSEAGGQYLGPHCQAPGAQDQSIPISKGKNQNTKCCLRMVNRIKWNKDDAGSRKIRKNYRKYRNDCKYN